MEGGRHRGQYEENSSCMVRYVICSLRRVGSKVVGKDFEASKRAESFCLEKEVYVSGLPHVRQYHGMRDEGLAGWKTC